MVPFWARDEKIGYRTINARAETVRTAASFREAFKRRRCVVPADGFYEWQKLQGEKAKRPHLIRMRGGAPFAFAGLWESWNGPEGPLQSATIITTEPNALMAPIHDRMPVIFDPDDWSRWLDPERPGGEDLLRPCLEEWLEAVPVSTAVNSPRNDGPELLAAAD